MRKVVLGQLVVVAGLLAGLPAAQADPLTAPGVVVNGSGGHLYLLGSCSTCPRVGPSASDSQGGNGVESASTELRNFPFFWQASGQLVTGTYLPELKAYAEADYPGEDGNYDFWVTASASSQALQRFVYTGAAPSTYTIDYTVDGELVGQGESISAGLGVFNGDYVPGSEGGGPSTVLGNDLIFLSTADLLGPRFAHTGSITFSIDPGNAFYVSAFLTANAFWTYTNLGGYADASHTFRSAFTAGDTSLLQPALQSSNPTPVPEPAALSLMLAGLATGTSAMRRARRQQR